MRGGRQAVGDGGVRKKPSDKHALEQNLSHANFIEGQSLFIQSSVIRVCVKARFPRVMEHVCVCVSTVARMAEFVQNCSEGDVDCKCKFHQRRC